MSTNEQTVTAFFVALSAGDLDAVAALCHLELVWTTMIGEIPGAGRHVGRDKVLHGFIGPVRALFRPGDPKVHIDNMISAGNTVLCETHATGERADGKSYNNRYAWVFELRDNKVAEIREYMDSLYVARFFDMIPGVTA